MLTDTANAHRGLRAAKQQALAQALSARSSQLFPSVYYSASTASTNDDCWAALGSVCYAQRQTRGRGRYGRAWDDHQGEQLFLSWRLSSARSFSTLPLVVGVSVCRALEDNFRLAGIQIKWPNDILHQERKLAGILVEARTEAGEQHYVCGVGVNIALPRAPSDDRYQHSCVSAIAATQGLKSPTRTELAAAILNQFTVCWEQLVGNGFDPLSAYWRAHNPHLGRRVQLSPNSTTNSAATETIIVGTFSDLSSEGYPIIVHPDGTTIHITSSNYSMRLAGTD